RTGADGRRPVSCLVYSVLQSFASLESRILRSLDLDGLAGLRVATLAGGALADLEGSEADQRDRVALLQRLGDDADHGVDGIGGVGLGQLCSVGDGSNKISLVHSYGLLGGGNRGALRIGRPPRTAAPRSTLPQRRPLRGRPAVASCYTSGILVVQDGKLAMTRVPAHFASFAEIEGSMLDVRLRGRFVFAPDGQVALSLRGRRRHRPLQRHVQHLVDPLGSDDL